jgi:hypothetical protein
MKACPQCGAERGDRRYCNACYTKEWREKRSGQVCVGCNEVRQSFSTSELCCACYHRERAIRKIGVCGVCGRTKRLPSRGVCVTCASERTMRAREPRPCAQCGRAKKVYARGRCKSCYQADKKNKSKYKVTLERFAEMVIGQCGKCAICGEQLRVPSIDHCHATGGTRALLCHLCNVGLGSFGDDPERMREAARYVESYRSRKVA